MKLWPIFALGICAFFVSAITWGFSTGSEVKVETPSYVSTVFGTSPPEEVVLPHESLLLMLFSSLVLAFLPVLYELGNASHVRCKRRAVSNIGFSLTQHQKLDLGMSEKELAEIGRRTMDVVRELKQRQVGAS